MTVVIRMACPTDINRLLEIENDVFESDRLSRRSFMHHLNNMSATLLVADEGGSVAGYALLLHPKAVSFKAVRPARIYSIAVSKEKVSQGIGRMLLNACEMRAKELGRGKISLEVRQDNKKAMGLYQAAGYKYKTLIPNYYADGMTALRFNKNLEMGR